MSSTRLNQDFRQDHDKLCYAFGCDNEHSEKINVSAGTFGTITLKLCNKCVNLFKDSNTLSSRGIFQK
ncbi:hypothetical protein [Candidatus Nitrosocosmicus franklandus]|uniref:Uncharacterized protein n=1 Tax=Candidatus Nitrosocosmicus franklandianus TaxID=1798806 RepID=A0A484I4K9_9ARCH|nr:hypothetical protein [Candidatus Nitrosocosmicus franklandus]VFJ12605.1 protein of unknown function [Candidatus Nitrosocosmicus franklandus]